MPLLAAPRAQMFGAASIPVPQYAYAGYPDIRYRRPIPTRYPVAGSYQPTQCDVVPGFDPTGPFNLGLLNVYYFGDLGPFAGRGGAIVTLLRAENIKSDYFELKYESNWFDVKAQMQSGDGRCFGVMIDHLCNPQGTLPVMLHETKVFCESTAILRYIARLCGLYGRDIWTDYIADMMIDKIEYWRDELMVCIQLEVMVDHEPIKDGKFVPPPSMDSRAEHLLRYHETREEQYNIFEAILQRCGEPRYLPDLYRYPQQSRSHPSHRFSWCDYALFTCLHDDGWIAQKVNQSRSLREAFASAASNSFMQDDTGRPREEVKRVPVDERIFTESHEILERHPFLQALYARMAEHPGLATWRQEKAAGANNLVKQNAATNRSTLSRQSSPPRAPSVAPSPSVHHIATPGQRAGAGSMTNIAYMQTAPRAVENIEMTSGCMNQMPGAGIGYMTTLGGYVVPMFSPYGQMAPTPSSGMPDYYTAVPRDRYIPMMPAGVPTPGHVPAITAYYSPYGPGTSQPTDLAFQDFSRANQINVNAANAIGRHAAGSPPMQAMGQLRTDSTHITTEAETNENNWGYPSYPAPSYTSTANRNYPGKGWQGTSQANRTGHVTNVGDDIAPDRLVHRRQSENRLPQPPPTPQAEHRVAHN